MNKKIISLLTAAGIFGAFGGSTVISTSFAESESISAETETESLTEEKLREMLPETMTEFNEFTEKNGMVSIHGKYIVYCDEINYSTGAEVVMEQLGTAEVKKAFEYNIKPDEPLPPGAKSHTIIVYEAVSSGTVEITISQGMPWEWEQSHVLKDHGYYMVNEEMNVSEISEEEFTPPVRGDANGDGDFTVADLVMLEKWLLGEDKLTCWKNADLCEDQVIDVYDLCVMRKEFSESKPDHTVMSVEAMRGNNGMEKIKNGVYTAASMSELHTLLKTAELCEYDGCKCDFHDVQSLVPNGIDESFFENNVLIAVYNSVGAGNKVLTIDKIEKTNDLLTVYTTTENPKIATPDMAYYRGFIAVSKTYFEGVSKVERNDTEKIN
ncbi:MAG: dockerin type I repeat-containing protein [Ruminococcus sp.]|nr:dockerin type I repeat-containing protein [Ruminococcus sp.]MBO5164912.1 dockerin type I repeat-containing protein [Ruminococcus sp.]